MIFIMYLILGIFTVVPLVLTVINLTNLCRRQKIKPMTVDILIIVLGIPFTAFLYLVMDMPEADASLLEGGGGAFFHSPLASSHAYTIYLFLFLAVVGYILLRFSRRQLSPLLKILSLTTIYAGILLSIAWICQLAPNLYMTEFTSSPVFSTSHWQCEILFLLLLPFNFIISSISLLLEVIREEKRELAEHQTSDILIYCDRLLGKGLNLPVAALVFLVPFLGLCVILLLAFGQQPDSAIQAFTQTSDWLFSTKVSPPPVPYQGHYLCTVAAGGHPRVVKPLRPGVRWGHPIIVNRQLCVANAFEELISEKTPRLHRFIRHQYDKHGYPLAEKIQTPLAADVTYILMKPLEWAFLFVLYLCDVKPENRIARQYLPPSLQTSKNKKHGS